MKSLFNLVKFVICLVLCLSGQLHADNGFNDLFARVLAGSKARPVQAKAQTQAAAPAKACNPLESCVTIRGLSSCGSGFFLRKDGQLYVATCAHVISHQPTIRIQDYDGRNFQPVSVWADSSQDVALIRIAPPAQPVKALTIASANRPYGTPIQCFGDGNTKGVIAREKGVIEALGPKNLEVSAPLLHGHSGGPVVLADSDQVVGMAAFITSPEEQASTIRDTRYEHDRRFAIRLDKVNWQALRPVKCGTASPYDCQALNRLALEALEDEDLGSYRALVERSAELGNAWAQNEYGINLFILGISLDTDIFNEEIYASFQKAARQSHPEALLNLGLCTYCGIGTEEDADLAVKLISRAAELGNAEARQIMDTVRQQEAAERLEYWRSRNASLCR